MPSSPQSIWSIYSLCTDRPLSGPGAFTCAHLSSVETLSSLFCIIILTNPLLLSIKSNNSLIEDKLSPPLFLRVFFLRRFPPRVRGTRGSRTLGISIFLLFFPCVVKFVFRVFIAVAAILNLSTSSAFFFALNAPPLFLRVLLFFFVHDFFNFI